MLLLLGDRRAFLKESQELSNDANVAPQLANCFLCLHMYSLWRGCG